MVGMRHSGGRHAHLAAPMRALMAGACGAGARRARADARRLLWKAPRRLPAFAPLAGSGSLRREYLKMVNGTARPHHAAEQAPGLPGGRRRPTLQVASRPPFESGLPRLGRSHPHRHLQILSGGGPERPRRADGPPSPAGDPR